MLMLIRIIAVGTRMPRWVEEAVTEYGTRLSGEIDIQWKPVRAETRGSSGNPALGLAREAERIRAVLPAGARIVALDERGDTLTSHQFAQTLGRWREDARDVAILIGGPDGLDAALKSEASQSLRLSSLTLPHPLVRILLAEQLFRAWSILSGHPYHRD